MKSLFDFLKRWNYVWLFLLLEITAVVMIVRSTVYQNGIVVEWCTAIAGRWHNTTHLISGYFGLKQENDRLAQENAQLRASMAESYISYSDSVFTVQDTVYRQRYSYTEAQVIKTSRTGQLNYLMINKGEHQGVHEDMAVISPQGMVGVVVNTTANFATIMPVVHPNSRHSVKLTRTGSNGSLVWEGGDYRYAYLTDIPSTHKLYSGDTVVTSGFSHDFPEGIQVGYIEEIDNLGGTGFYHVRIRLATDFSNLGHVYVIDNHFKAEQDTLIAHTQKTMR
ncbi:MAG: rod shape-determining protein MreC [Bacteroidales bacterium]|nr:rod shape-determining protein MreC [Bacteroidales bacterium]